MNDMFATNDLFALAEKVNEFVKTQNSSIMGIDVSGRITVTIEVSQRDMEAIDKDLSEMNGINPDENNTASCESVECTISGVNYKLVRLKEPKTR